MLSDSPLQTQFSFCLKNCWIKCGTKLQNAGDTLQINKGFWGIFLVLHRLPANFDF